VKINDRPERETEQEIQMEKETEVQEKEVIIEDNIVKIEQEVEELEADSTEETDPTKVEKPEVEKPAYSEPFNKKIEGKTADELKSMLYESEKFSGKLGNELGDLRNFKRDSETPKTSTDIKARIEKTDSKIATIDAEIKKLDAELDDDEIADLLEKKNHLLQKKADYGTQHMEMFVKEIVEKQGAGEHNQKVSQNARDTFAKDYGQSFSDDDWDAIKGYAESVSKDYRVAEEDYEYALMKALTPAKYKALNRSMAEVNVRNNIEKAETKAVPTIGGKGKSYLTIDIENMSEYALGKELDKLSDTELAKLKRRINKG